MEEEIEKAGEKIKIEETTRSNAWIYAVIGILLIALAYTFVTPSAEIEILNNETDVLCLIKNTELYVSAGCKYCSVQKDILGDYLNLFNIIDCTVNATVCVEAGVSGVPMWIINNESNVGILEVEQLREMTGC